MTSPSPIAKISDPHGTWEMIGSPHERTNTRTILAVGGVAILAISALVTGGVLLSIKVPVIVPSMLLGGGGGVFILSALAATALYYVRHPKRSTTYRVVSWNIGTRHDYAKMCFLKAEIATGQDFKEAYQAYVRGSVKEPNKEEMQQRTIRLQQILSADTPDILCLQQSHEMQTDEAVQAILPQGYAFYRAGNPTRLECECTVAWNPAKFDKIGHANMVYDPEYIQSLSLAPDTLVLLKDRDTSTTICVGSAHLRGVDLSTPQEQHKNSTAGNNQARYDLDTMKASRADLFLFAGDFNVTEANCPERFSIIRSYAYKNDPIDTTLTGYEDFATSEDQAPRVVKRDHFFVKGSNGHTVGIKQVAYQNGTVTLLDTPSGHLPIIAEVSCTRSLHRKDAACSRGVYDRFDM